MKNRQELILDFMLALAPCLYGSDDSSIGSIEDVYKLAAKLSDEYLRRI